MITYHYRVLRYVNDVYIDEFVNVGVMMWIPEYDELMFEATSFYERFSQFFSDFDGTVYREMVQNTREDFKAFSRDLDILRLYKGHPRKPSDIFFELVNNDPTCLQWSPLISGVCTSPDQRFEQLFNEYVGQHKKNPPTQYDKIWAVVDKALEAHQLKNHVQLNFPMRAANVDWKFKMGWNNGIQQVLEPMPLAFKRPLKIIDTANIWSGRLDILADRHNFKCTAVVSKKPNNDNIEAYYQAFEILENVQSMCKVITENEVPEYISEIENDLAQVNYKTFESPF